MVIWAIENTEGGEILLPKIPSYRITDVADYRTIVRKYVLA